MKKATRMFKNCKAEITSSGTLYVTDEESGTSISLHLDNGDDIRDILREKLAEADGPVSKCFTQEFKVNMDINNVVIF